MNKLKPAVLGGLVVGILSAIPFVNYCCCLWAIGGGLLAGMLYIKESPLRITPGNGAMIGALAGVVGGLIYLILGIPIAIFYGAAAMEQAFKNSGVQMPLSGLAMIILGSLFGALCLIVLSTLGGLIAVPIFEKRKDAVAPPPPVTPGGGPGSYPG
jgi:hypothetical protein